MIPTALDTAPPLSMAERARLLRQTLARIEARRGRLAMLADDGDPHRASRLAFLNSEAEALIRKIAILEGREP